MSQALVALLPLLLIRARALRPQEDAGQDKRFTSNWGAPGTSWLELGEQPQGNTSREDVRTLAVGHSASLQQQASKNRSTTQDSLANAGFALAQFALTESGPGTNGSGKTVLATPTLQTKEPPNTQVASNKHEQSQGHADSKPTHSGADSPKEARFRVGQRVEIVTETRPTGVETTIGMIGKIVQDKSDKGWSEPYEVQFDNGRSEWYKEDWMKSAPAAEQPTTQTEVEARFRLGQAVKIAPGRNATVNPGIQRLLRTRGMVGEVSRIRLDNTGQFQKYKVELYGYRSSMTGQPAESYPEDWLQAATAAEVQAAKVRDTQFRAAEDRAREVQAAKEREMMQQRKTAVLGTVAGNQKDRLANDVVKELDAVDNGDFPPVNSPVSDVFNDGRGVLDAEAPYEAEQEMDDIIVDMEEIERVGGKLVRKIEKFWSEEGFRHIVLNLGVYFAGIFISLGLYATCFRHRDTKLEQEFRYGACECLGDGRVCLCGLCCPAIRWADTISEEKGGFLDFNSALLVMMGLGFTLLCPYTGVFAWIGIVVIGVYYRQRIRLRYGLEADTIQSYVEDTLIWCCCAWCAICQEARQVDEETEEVEEPVNEHSNPKTSIHSRAGTSW